MNDGVFGLQPCDSCRYAVQIKMRPGHFHCHKHPPGVFPMMQGNMVSQLQLRPEVTKDESCADGIPRIAIAEGVSRPEIPMLTSSSIFTKGNG